MSGCKQTHISGAENNTTSIGSTWYGTNQASYNDYTGIYYGMGYNGVSTTRAIFIPKITFTTISSSIPVTLGDNGYTTFACPRPLDLTDANLPSGLKAYKAAVEDDRVNFTEINQAVAANTGILLEGTAGKTYHIPVADEGSEPADNEFLVNSTGGTFSAESGYTYYGMLKNSNPLTFGVFDPSAVAIPTNKAYLKVGSGAASRQLVAAFHWDVTTGIEDSAATTCSRKPGSVFSLTGQQVKKPAKGLYIIDGKKHIIK